MILIPNRRRILNYITFLDSDKGTAGAGNPTVQDIPATVRDGDILFYAQRVQSSSGSPSPDLNSGFTNILLGASNTVRSMRFSYKIAVDADAGQTVTTTNGGQTNLGILLVFRLESGEASSITVQDTDEQVTNDDPTAQVITSSGGTVPLISLAFFFGKEVTGFTPSFSPTETGSQTVTGGNGEETHLMYKIYNKFPSNITADMDDEGVGNQMMTCYLEVG